MIKKAKNIIYGIKGTTQTHSRLSSPHKTVAEPQSRIDICLSCTKPASECKGNCFGRSN
jgi:hypothetical protein